MKEKFIGCFKELKEQEESIYDLYFETGNRVLFDGYYNIESYCEEGDWQYVVKYLNEDGEWDAFEDGYFCYFDSCTKEVTSLEVITKDWIVPFFIDELKSRANEED